MSKKKRRTNKTALILLIPLAIIIILVLTAKLEKPAFREDSIDNPHFKSKNPDTKPSILEGSSNIGVILTHGLGATTYETKKLAEFLNEKNITTYQVLLTGHGENIYNLEKTTSEEFYHSLEEAYNKIQTPNKFIIGSSIGSLLAIELSQNKQPNGIILFSTPIIFNDKRIKYTPLLKYFKRFYHRDIEEGHQPYYHENFPIKTLAEMVTYINKIKATLPQVNTPTLIIQSKNDPRLDPKSAQYIYNNIGSEKKEIMWLNSNKHVLMIEYAYEDETFKNERLTSFNKAYDFIIDNSI